MKVQDYGFNGRFESPKKNISVNFSKGNTNTCLSLHCNGDNSYLFVNWKKSLSLKPVIEISNFSHSFVLETYLMDLAVLSKEKYL